MQSFAFLADIANIVTMVVIASILRVMSFDEQCVWVKNCKSIVDVGTKRRVNV